MLFNFVKRHSLLTVMAVAILIVILPWSWLWWVTLESFQATGKRDLGAHGQFGDAFGSLNALFTGLALIGLVYTVYLQRKQTEAQTEQLDAQKLEASRQAREQFLTARLNAQVALLQTKSAYNEVARDDSEVDPAIARDAAKRQVLLASIAIELIRQEVKQGFEGGAWSATVEKEAIRGYFVALLQGYCNVCGWLHARGAYDLATAQSEHLRAVCEQLEFLAEYLRIGHLEASNVVVAAASKLRGFQNEPNRALEWCGVAESMYRRGEKPWA